MTPRRGPLLLLGALLWGCPPVFAGQEVTPKGGMDEIASTRPAPASVDPRFHSPRATVRTFLIAMNQAEDDPNKIEQAAACLDLSGMPPDRRDGGRLAFELEFVLRSTSIPTPVIPDVVDGPYCEVGEG